MTAAALVLPAQGGVIAVLLVLALLSPRLPVRGVAGAITGLCSLVLLGSLATLLSAGAATVSLPVGLGLVAGRLTLDPLTAWFLLATGLTGLASAGAGQGGRSLPAVLAAVMLTVLSGDTGLAIIGLAAIAALCGARSGGVLLIAGSLAILAAGPGTEFAAIRTLPPEGWHAAIVLLLLLAGVVLVAGSGALRRLQSGDARGSAAPYFVLLPTVVGYVLCRAALDLSGPATPTWWGAPFLLVGGSIAAAGAAFGARAVTVPSVLAGLAVMQAGWVVAGIGVVAVGRAADLLPLATLAASGVLLQVLNLAAFGTLAALVTEAVGRGAGSQMLDRLGGLAARMPVAAVGMLVAGTSLALLPPSAGFASAWMLLQAAFAATRLGGLGLHLLLAFTSIALVASAGLAVAAIVRLVGIAFLGRPRTPRAAAADDASQPQRAVILGLVALSVMLGLFPGLAVRLADPAQRVLTHALSIGQAGWAGLQTQQGAPGYAPLAAALLLVAGMVALVFLVRRFARAGSQTAPTWEDGFTAPPAWMPFGEPATQATAASLAALLPGRPFRPALPRIRLRLEAEWPRIAPAHAAATLLGLAVILVVAVLLLGPP